MTEGIITILVAGFLAVAWFAMGIPARIRCDRRLRRATSGKGVSALTYDDGPGSETTPKLLDLLPRHDVRATFFVIGGPAGTAPELLERMVSAGHTVAWHTHTHHNQGKTDPIRGLADLRIPPSLRAGALGRSVLFRPPFGKMTLGTVLLARIRGWRIVTWTHPSGDTYRELPDPSEIAARIDHDGGGVALMHDMDREDPERERFVLRTTVALIDLAHRREWTFAHTPTDWARLT